MEITPDGMILTDKFRYTDYSSFRWWDYGIKDDYVEELKSVAVYQGFAPEEIEDFIYQAD